MMMMETQPLFSVNYSPTEFYLNKKNFIIWVFVCLAIISLFAIFAVLMYIPLKNAHTNSTSIRFAHFI